MRALVLIAALLAAGTVAAPATGDTTLVASRPIRAKAVIGPGDLTTMPGATPGALARPEDAVGMEARVAIYAGWPVREGDLGPPAIVERNQLVTLQFRRFGLEIATEGRALGRAGLGEKVRVMNLDSRTIVTGAAVAAGVVEVR